MIKHLPNLIGYLAPKNYEYHLIKELKYKNIKIEKVHDRLIIAEKCQKQHNVFWQQNTWEDLFEMQVDSVKQCALQLKKIHKYWYHFSPILHLRCKLIQENLPHVKVNDFKFPINTQINQLGSFTLLSQNTALCSKQTTSKFPNGEINFIEDHTNPPNRAYLKLWEIFTIINKYPQKNETIIELGSSPGGWTWVLQQFETNIFSCDKSPLDPKLLDYKNLQFVQQDAFKILPNTQTKRIDWLLSDLICYPDKLLQYIKIWIESNQVNNIICTLKFQGEIDYQIIDQFASIQNSKIYHLSVNKNELTYVWHRQIDNQN